MNAALVIRSRNTALLDVEGLHQRPCRSVNWTKVYTFRKSPPFRAGKMLTMSVIADALRAARPALSHGLGHLRTAAPAHHKRTGSDQGGADGHGIPDHPAAVAVRCPSGRHADAPGDGRPSPDSPARKFWTDSASTTRSARLQVCHRRGVLYAVLLAFAVIVVWEKFSEAENAAAREASAIATLYRLAAGISGNPGTALRDNLGRYIRTAVAEDLARHGAGHG